MSKARVLPKIPFARRGSNIETRRDSDLPVSLRLGEFSPRLRCRLLILQPTPFCNIHCDYCYLPNRDSKARMKLSTVRQAARRLVEDGLAGDNLDVVWHAGEPLVVPPAFYEEAIAVIGEELGPDRTVSHCIQTNGTLIDGRWCALFKRHRIRVGISIDGPAELHDRHRKTRSGRGTHAAVLRGLAKLREHGIAFHVIAVVGDATLRRPAAFIDFFLSQGVHELGCSFDEAEGEHVESSLTGREAEHARFLNILLERSIRSGGRLRVREFSNALRLISEGLPTYAWRGEEWPDNPQVMPFGIVSVACNGDFSTFSPELLGQPSARYANFRLGNVASSGYVARARCENFSRLWADIRRGTAACRRSCAHFAYCGGGAPANKLYENDSFASGETLYCRTMVKRPFDILLTRLESEADGSPRYPS